MKNVKGNPDNYRDKRQKTGMRLRAHKHTVGSSFGAFKLVNL
jgi:hypothetical protein